MDCALGASLPDCWIAAAVEDRQNDNAPRFRTEVDACMETALL